jgi:hypothetical protein
VISRLTAILAWLAAGHALLAGLFWLLLATPESNAAMLAASALIAMSMTLLYGWVEAAGLLAWREATAPWKQAGRAFRATPGVWVGTTLFVLIWYLAAHAGTWWIANRGEIDAWLTLHFGSTNPFIVDRTEKIVLAVVQFLGLSLALSLAAALMNDGYRAIASARWLRSGISPRQLLLLAAALFVFVWLPWQAVNWHPKWLKPNWQEEAFVTAKLGAVYLLANVGWAQALGAAARKR